MPSADSSFTSIAVEHRPDALAKNAVWLESAGA
jgi:hypothetical protein